MRTFLIGAGTGGFALILMGIFMGMPEMQWFGTQLIVTTAFLLAMRSSD